MKALIFLAVLSIVALLAEIFKFKKYLLPVVVAGLFGGIFLLFSEWGYDNTYYKMIRVNNYSIVFMSIILFTAALWFLFSKKYLERLENKSDYFALILFSLVGAYLLTNFNHMVVLFLGVEILSIPIYVLAGSRKDDLSSNEAGMKYFLMGAFATGILLLGIAFIYGATGSFIVTEIQDHVMLSMYKIPGLVSIGTVLIFLALAFKVSAVPMHFWAPDVYKGAPSYITAFMASVVKVAAFAAFFKLASACFFYSHDEWVDIIWIMSFLSIVVGNFIAAYQSNVKRMLAYSSISHAGFMLMAVLSVNEFSITALLYYALAYSLATIGAFSVLTWLSTQTGNEELSSLSGLAKKNPLAAIGLTVALLSMAGIPPLAGFFGKYYMFMSSFEAGFPILVIVAVIMSLVAVYYYFKVIITMFNGPSHNELKDFSLTQKTTLWICIIGLLALGLFPDLLLGFCDNLKLASIPTH